METLVANLVASAAVRAILNGREYYVAPLSLIVPNTVLPGSKGPLFYPDEECARNVEHWDKVPLTLYHPFDPVTGANLSARSPGVMNRQAIGFVRHPDHSDKLRAYGYFDAERTADADKRFGTDVLNRLKNGQAIELSTGLFTDNELAPSGSTANGRPYDYIARNYKPDHVAVLPTQVGACSIADGCGVLVNAEKPPSKPNDCPT